MFLSTNEIIIILSILFILSYIFNYISSKIKIPSVLLLIGTGLILKAIAERMGINFIFSQSSLELIGTFGLILIVLEASMDLKLAKEDMPVVRSAFGAATIILLVSALVIAFIIKYWLNTSFHNALINALPLAVISSAIAIPSVSLMNKKIKDFIIYESTFSDIMGIMIFNYVIHENLFSYITFGVFLLNFLFILLISFVGSMLLIFLMNRITHQIKFFLLLSILLLIYALGKEFHLPSLLLIMVFGLMIGNSKYLIHIRLSKYFNAERIPSELIPFKTFTEETAFLIRTFFFVLFGYSVNIIELAEWKIIIPGFIITLAFLIIRFVYLRFTVKVGYRLTKLFLAPRGLITVILFYSIPAKYIIPEFSVGIVFFVIMLSGLMMTISLWMGESELNRLADNKEL